MTAAQKAAQATVQRLHRTCGARLGKDRCNRIEGHKERTHRTVGPTGVTLHWTVTSQPPLPARAK